ncbi:hypothetical protein CRPA8_45210 [Pseudomonas aeruginosa]
MSRYAFVSTDVLDIAYLEWNPQGARSAVLLHGWPDSPHAWKDLAESLADALSGAGTSPPGIRPDPLPRCVYSAQRATGGSGLRSAGIRRQPGIATSPAGRP